MSYEAVVTKIRNIRNHPNADRLNLATASGYQVIVSKNTKEGTLGIFFPSDGQLSLELCKKNNLHRHKYLNEDQKAKGGFFDDNRRVRAQKFRGSLSEGFWTDLNVLEFTGYDLSKLKEGDLLKSLNGIPLCNKYYTRATRKAMSRRGKSSKKGFKALVPTFLEHFDTKKLRMVIGKIPEGALLSLSEKCHGTSGRTGHLYQELELNKFQKIWNSTIGRFGPSFQNKKWVVVTGTRRVVLDPCHTVENGFYEKEDFRIKIHNQIKESGIPKGFTLYYEIVGFTGSGRLIMSPHDIKDKELQKKYGNKMVYKYNCDVGTNRVLVYRITHTNEDGHVIELPLHQVLSWCDRLGLEVVPQLHDPFVYDGDQNALMSLCNKLSSGPSVLDLDHIKEGVVVRVDAPGHEYHVKYKSYHFCDMEGIAKNSDKFVDLEEVS